MQKESSAINIIGAVPCLICHRALTQNDVNEQKVMCAGIGDNLQVACLSHFFIYNGNTWSPTVDYMANFTKLVRAAQRANPDAGPGLIGVGYGPDGKIMDTKQPGESS